MPFVFAIGPVFLLFVGGQVYFALRFGAFLRRVLHNRTAAIAAIALALAVYIFVFASYVSTARDPHPPYMTWHEALINAPFLWWIYSSTLGFLVVVLIWLIRAVAFALRSSGKLFRSQPAAETPPSPARRQFLERTAAAAVAAPFVAGAYGLLWGRLNVQITHQKIPIARLPRAFHGFRIAQLSDIHIGPYMSQDEIRKYVGMANQEKAELIALTGDFVTWEADPQEAVVAALSGLKAPFGVYGCLGNHDAWADAEGSLTALFAQSGVHILRQERTALRSGGDSLNLIGIDFANSGRMSAGPGHLNSRTLAGVEDLMSRDTPNILLSHNPDTFDRAAQLGIDFSLAGHTHGGQLALEFISPEIAPSRIVTPYVAGLFQQPGGQLYVNRGIGTIAAPMRVGAPPEITIFELVRA